MQYTRSDISCLVYGLHCADTVLFKLLQPSQKGWFRQESIEEGVTYHWEPMGARPEPEVKQILRRAAEESKSLMEAGAAGFFVLPRYSGGQDALEREIMAFVEKTGTSLHQGTIIGRFPWMETKICMIRLVFKGLLQYDWGSSRFDLDDCACQDRKVAL